MFFLVRCVFFLGLVFSWIDWSGEGNLAADIRTAATPLAESAVAAASAKVEKTCLAAIRDCVEGAARINRLASDVADAAASRPGASRKPSSDTLTVSDRGPRWQGASLHGARPER
jgi:hypothetical protein